MELTDGNSYCLKTILGKVELDGGTCSHWASPDGTGKYRYQKYACYAPFIRTHGVQRAELYIGLCQPKAADPDNPMNYDSLWENLRDEVDWVEGHQRWIEWLMYRSPHKGAIMPGQKAGYNRFVKMNVEATNHLVHHTACALRITQEHRRVPMYWILFTNAGMEEDLAYLLSLLVRCDRGRLVAGQMVSHSALSSVQRTCLAGFLLRRYEEDNASWRHSRDYVGHGSMWDCGRGGLFSNLFDVMGLFSKHPRSPASRSPFDPAPAGSYPTTTEGFGEFVAFATEEAPKMLGVKLIVNPTGDVKYEEA